MISFNEKEVSEENTDDEYDYTNEEVLEDDVYEDEENEQEYCD